MATKSNSTGRGFVSEKPALSCVWGSPSKKYEVSTVSVLAIACKRNNPTGTKSDWGGPNSGTRIAAPVKLSTPTGVSATDNRTDGINITWNSVSGASYYGVWYGGAPSYNNNPDFGGPSNAGGWNGFGTSFLDTAVGAGTTRDYYVQAYASGNPAGTKSDWSAGDSGTRTSVPVVSAPATPANPGLTGSGVVTWDASAGAASYELQFYTASNGGGSNQAGPYFVTGIGSSPHQLTSPYGGTNANWARVQVRARNTGGVSLYGAWKPSSTTYT